jgi:hypothetical protein
VALNFPSSPTIGQVYTDATSGFSYEWNGTVWISFSAASSSQIKPLDDISGSFDDVTQTFALTSNSVSITPPTAQSLIINLGGVIQDATDDYSVTSSNITFSTPPASGLSFSGVSLGPAIPINTIPDGTVTDGSLTVAGILSTSNLFVTGVSTFAGITTVTGTTLFTKQLNVSGVSTFTTGPVLIGSATSTGTASQPLQVTGGVYVSGNLGIGTTNPTHKLHVLGDARITGILTVGTGSITLDGSTNTISGITTINTTSINGGPLAGFRNAIINGNFDFWQRGTSFTGSAYGADRWFSIRLGTTHTATRQAFTAGQTDVPGEPTYFCRTVVSSVAGAGNNARIVQKIEDVRTFAGQQVTVSFWAKVDATKNIAVELVQDFGTGGSPSASVNSIGTTKISIGTTWQKVTVAATVPSISGKTLGTNSDHVFILRIWFDAGSNFNTQTDTLGQQSGTFEIAQVQIEAGPVATPFERRPIGVELALCQRYFEKSFDLANAPAQAIGTTNGAFCAVQVVGQSAAQRCGSVTCKTPKRSTPTITLFNPIASNAQFYNANTGGSTTSTAAGSVGENGFHLDTVTQAGSGAAGNGLFIHWTASAEL